MSEEKTKKTKHIKDNAQLDVIKEHAIKLTRIVLNDNVTTWSGTPENAFYAHGSKAQPQRQANIWYATHTVLIEQKNGHNIVLPTSAVKYAIV